MGQLRIKRIYDEASDDDGVRVLVDRLWPRGVAKADARLDEWCKGVAPSPELRKWWDHDADRMDEFAAKYRAELDEEPDAVDELLGLARENDTVTLLYGAKSPEVNHAVILRDYLEAHA